MMTFVLSDPAHVLPTREEKEGAGSLSDLKHLATAKAATTQGNSFFMLLNYTGFF